MLLVEMLLEALGLGDAPRGHLAVSFAPLGRADRKNGAKRGSRAQAHNRHS